jgi:hypothetical protein
LTQSVFIFISGLGGVFLGMALLYLSIRVTAFVIGKWAIEEEEK